MSPEVLLFASVVLAVVGVLVVALLSTLYRR